MEAEWRPSTWRDGSPVGRVSPAPPDSVRGAKATGWYQEQNSGKRWWQYRVKR